MDIKGTRSEENIKKSFVNEAEAIIRYLIYADTAKKEGNTAAAELFKRMAKNELEHAKTWFRYIHDTDTDTLTNLAHSAGSENAEWKTIYPNAAMTAKAEGLSDIAAMFEKIASIECDHERRFMEQLISEGEKAVEQPTAKTSSYFCLFCGMSSDSLKEICDVCGAVKSFVKES